MMLGATGKGTGTDEFILDSSYSKYPLAFDGGVKALQIWSGTVRFCASNWHRRNERASISHREAESPYTDGVRIKSVF